MITFVASKTRAQGRKALKELEKIKQNQPVSRKRFKNFSWLLCATLQFFWMTSIRMHLPNYLWSLKWSWCNFLLIKSRHKLTNTHKRCLTSYWKETTHKVYGVKCNLKNEKKWWKVLGTFTNLPIFRCWKLVWTIFIISKDPCEISTEFCWLNFWATLKSAKI